VTTESFHHSLQFFALVIVAITVGKDTFDTG